MLSKLYAVGYPSALLINGIISACKPDSSIILSAQDLAMLELGALETEAASSSDGFTDVADSAGSVCGPKESSVDAMIGYQVPLMAALLLKLANGNMSNCPSRQGEGVR